MSGADIVFLKGQEAGMFPLMDGGKMTVISPGFGMINHPLSAQ